MDNKFTGWLANCFAIDDIHSKRANTHQHVYLFQTHACLARLGRIIKSLRAIIREGRKLRIKLTANHNKRAFSGLLWPWKALGRRYTWLYTPSKWYDMRMYASSRCMPTRDQCKCSRPRRLMFFVLLRTQRRHLGRPATAKKNEQCNMSCTC